MNPPTRTKGLPKTEAQRIARGLLPAAALVASIIAISFGLRVGSESETVGAQVVGELALSVGFLSAWGAFMWFDRYDARGNERRPAAGPVAEVQGDGAKEASNKEV